MIIFTQQPDGSYKKEGELSSRRAQIQINDLRPFGNYGTLEAVGIIEEAIAKGQVRAERYSVLAAADVAMPEEVKEKFAAINAAKKAERGVRMVACSFGECSNEYPRGKGRYPNKFCPEHREKK